MSIEVEHVRMRCLLLYGTYILYLCLPSGPLLDAFSQLSAFSRSFLEMEHMLL